MRTRTLTKIGAVLVVLVALLVAGAFVAVKLVDLNQVKEVLTTQVKKATGRTLTIAGPLELHIGLTPSVVAKGITLSNPSGSTRPEMAKIESFEMEMAILPLLERKIVVNRLILSSPDILIETEAKGPGNLDFAAPSQPAEAKPGDQQPSAGGGETNFRFTIKELKMTNAAIAWHDRTAQKTESFTVRELSLQPDHGGADLLAVRLLAEVDKQSFELQGSIGGPETMLSGKPWPLNLTVKLPAATLQVEGVIADLAAFHGIKLKATVQGAELVDAIHLAQITHPQLPASIGPFKVSAQLLDNGNRFDLTDLSVEVGKADILQVTATGTVQDLAGSPTVDTAVTVTSGNPAAAAKLTAADYPGKGPVKLAGRLQRSGIAWKMAGLKLTAGSSDLGGDVSVQLAARPKITGKLAANTINLRDFVSMPAPAATNKPAETAATKGDKGDGRVFPNNPLPVSALRSVDADLSLQVGKLLLDANQLTDVSMTAQLKGGNLSVKPLRLGVAGGTVETEANLDASGKIPAIALRVNGRQVELGKLDTKGTITGGKSDIKADLKGSGESVRALMASLTGETSVSVGEGRLRSKALDMAAGDLLVQVLGAINPFAKGEDTTQMVCAAARFVIRDGVATADKGIALRTSQVDVVGSGTVDLRSEKLDLGVKPKTRSGVGISLTAPLAGLVKVSGTMAKPSIGIDAVGTLKTAASVGAGIATGGLSTVGEMLIDKATGDDDPCRTALGQSPQGQNKTKTESKSNQESQQKGGPGGLLKGVFGH
ncbi:MAG: AsmA family protein [Desulfobulbus sp.]|nr:AsmA family protein [Desulfobulbus sp.]